MDLKEILKDVDRDIRVNVVNLDILNAVSFGKTFDEKRQIFIQEMTREVDRLRRTDYSRCDRKPFAWDVKYLGKPIEHWMIEQAVDAGLEQFAHEDGIKYQRVNLENGCYIYLDSDGDRVHEDRKVPKGATGKDFVWSKMKHWAAAVPVNTKPLLEISQNNCGTLSKQSLDEKIRGASDLGPQKQHSFSLSEKGQER